MKRVLAVSASVATASALAIGGAQAQDNARTADHQGVSGRFNLQAMMHQSTAQFPTLAGVKPWDGKSRGTGFAYRSIPCRGNAPINNVSSNLPSYNTRIRGSRAPSSTRLHPFRFSVKRTSRGTEMRGRIVLTVCKLDQGPTANPDPVPDESKPQIRMSFRAKFKRHSVDAVRFNGTFRITSGSFRYDDLRGSGRLEGYLFCFNQGGCNAEGGRFQDGQISLQGNYSDPTPELAAG